MSEKPTVAVLGASQLRHKFGNKSVRAHQAAGWDVYPVNLGGDPVEGLPTYRKLSDVPAELDRITVYLPPIVSLEFLDDIVQKGAKEVWFNPGAADARVLRVAKEKGIHAVDGCSIVDLGLSPSQFP